MSLQTSRQPGNPQDSLDIPAFYIVGGTMPRTALSYIERQADRDLYDWLRAGDFCYVLTSRQMGKSSLMIRTSARLRKEAGISTAIIDLTGVGQNLSLDQWYGGMLRRIGRQLDLEDEIDDYWRKESSLAPLQRWLATLTDVVLKECPEKLVIFVDEIDAVRSLPFKTDEFFAGIRECYNRRAAEPIFRKLTFCLLGVATPSRLISDPHLTPFNIGRRVELRDFLPSEAKPLALGLLHPGLIGPTEQISQGLLDRILYWTDGHPYLTQRFGQAVSEDRSVRTIRDIDQICGEIFLGKGAQEKDDNLLFVRESLLRGPETPDELASTLQLYATIRAGKKIEEDSADPVITTLRLSGITKADRGILKVRNRIYQTVFNKEWVIAGLPGAELRRHRAAYLSGVRRTLIVSATVLLVLASLIWIVRRQAVYAEQKEREQRRLVFWADIKIASQAIDQKNLTLAIQTLKAHQKEGATNFVWRYLWKQCHDDSRALQIPGQPIYCAAFSPDNHSIALGARDGTVHIQDLQNRTDLAVFKISQDKINAISYSPDGRYLAVGCLPPTGSKGNVFIWSLSAKRIQASFTVPYLINSVQFLSEKGANTRRILRVNDQFWKWDATGNSPTPFVDSFHRISALFPNAHRSQCAVSPDGTLIGISSPGNAPVVFDSLTQHSIRQSLPKNTVITALSFSPNSHLLAGATIDGEIHLWSAKTGQEITAFRAHTATINSLSFSQNGRQLAMTGKSKIAKIWPLDGIDSSNSVRFKGYSDVRLKGFRPVLQRVLFHFSQDGNTVLSHYDYGKLIRIWNTVGGKSESDLPFNDFIVVWSLLRPNGRELIVFRPDKHIQVFDPKSHDQISPSAESELHNLLPLAYSPDKHWLATISTNTPGKVTIQNLQESHLSFSLPVYKRKSRSKYVRSAAFSSDGKLLATGITDKTVDVWNLSQRKLLMTLGGHRKEVRFIAFTRDDTLLASACTDGIIRFWDVSLGREVFTLNTETDKLADLMFTPDGLEMKAVYEAGIIRTWRIASDAEITGWESEKRVL
jgi:WD40 repeat protein